MKHLSEAERVEFDDILKRLNCEKEVEKDRLMKRLGALANKSDHYCAFEIETDKEDCLPVEGGKYNAIWNEAAAMRKSGELLNLAYEIKCPVVAIHGEYDPHPAQGVHLSLQERVKNFKFFVLSKCGHSPWKEKHAYQAFYEILRNEIEE